VAEKCKYFVIKHKLQHNKWIIDKRTDNNIQITIKDDNGIEQQILQNQCCDGELALGVMFSPSGKMDDEVKYLRKRTENWAELVRTGHLRHSEAWLALKTTVMKTIEYALPTTTLTKLQLDQIMHPVISAGLSKSGICRI
jgi:hypothetical protein